LNKQDFKGSMKDGGMAQVEGHLFSKRKALCSNPSNKKNKQTKNPKQIKEAWF
jgi:hypothetical protein